MYWIWKKIDQIYNKVESRKVHNMHIMQELLTNKPNFPFNHTECFYKNTHVARYSPTLFIDIITLYILIPLVLCRIDSNGIKWSHYVHYNIFQTFKFWSWMQFEIFQYTYFFNTDISTHFFKIVAARNDLEFSNSIM